MYVCMYVCMGRKRFSYQSNDDIFEHSCEERVREENQQRVGQLLVAAAHDTGVSQQGLHKGDKGQVRVRVEYVKHRHFQNETIFILRVCTVVFKVIQVCSHCQVCVAYYCGTYNQHTCSDIRRETLSRQCKGHFHAVLTEVKL